MAKNDKDDLLMGTQVLTTKEARDSDGDGISDAEEDLAGATGPVLKPLDDDIRGDIGGPDRELDVDFDPTAGLPEGMSITNGLAGLTNVDGTAFDASVDHDGVGEDAIFGDHSSGENPLDMGRNPFATTPGGKSESGSGVGGGGSSVHNPKYDWVSAPADENTKSEDLMGLFGKGGAEAPKGKTPEEKMKEKSDGGQSAAEKAWQEKNKGKMDDGTGGTGGTGSPVAPTQDQIDLIIARQGDATKPVDGGGTQIDPPTSPPPDQNDQIINKGDGSSGGDLGGTIAPAGAMNAPVINQINPDSGFVRPQPTAPPPGTTGGGNSGGNTGEPVPGQDAMTASEGGSTQQMSVVGSGGSGIQSTAPVDGPATADAPAAIDLVSGMPDAASRPTDGATAVDSFASEYLEEAAARPEAEAGIIIPDVDRPAAPELEAEAGIIIPDVGRPAAPELEAEAGIIIPDTDRPAAPELQEADLVTNGLVADLGSDLAQVEDGLAGRPELIDEPIELLAIDEPDDGLDDGLGSA